jgi:hypothetical protein
VVGTLIASSGNVDLVASRSISDADGPKIADTFYHDLFKMSSHSMADSSGPDTTRAAIALHTAVSKLRSEDVSFIRWVPFIHLGR